MASKCDSASHDQTSFAVGSSNFLAPSPCFPARQNVPNSSSSIHSSCFITFSRHLTPPACAATEWGRSRNGVAVAVPGLVSAIRCFSLKVLGYVACPISPPFWMRLVHFDSQASASASSSRPKALTSKPNQHSFYLAGFPDPSLVGYHGSPVVLSNEAEQGRQPGKLYCKRTQRRQIKVVNQGTHASVRYLVGTGDQVVNSDSHFFCCDLPADLDVNAII